MVSISAVGLKDMDLSTAKVLKGTCTDMCAEKRYLLEVHRLSDGVPDIITPV